MRIRVGETAIGATDALGKLEAEVDAMNGDRYPLYAPCPADYETGEVPKEVVFLKTRGSGKEKNANIEVHVRCSRRVRIAAVLVDAAGREGMPILVDGVAVGATGPSGFAHLRLEGPTAKQFQVSLDTSSVAEIRPRNPRYAIQLGAEDGIFVFAPTFSEAVPTLQPKRKRRRRRRGSEARTGSKRGAKAL